MAGNLVSKVIVDRRGVTTTKWVRPDHQAGTQKEFATPLVNHAQNVASTVSVFEPPRSTPEHSVWSSQRVLIRYHLEASTPAYVNMVQKLGNLSRENNKPTAVMGRAALARYLERGKTDVLRAMGAHSNLIEGLPQHTRSMCILFDALLSHGISGQNEDGSVPHLDAYLTARSHYEKARMGRSNYAMFDSYEKNHEYLAMVSKHAENIDQLLEYRRSRLLDVHPDGPQTLDDDDFKNYLAHGALATGTL